MYGEMFIVSIILIGILPLLLLLQIRSLADRKQTWITSTLLISLILIYCSLLLFFYINNWEPFVLNYGPVLLVYKPTIILSFILLFIILTSVGNSIFGESNILDLTLSIYILFFSINLTAAFDLTSMFLLLESLNICTFILLSTRSEHVINLATSLRYLTISMITMGILLLGVIVISITCGTTQYYEINKFISYTDNNTVFIGIGLVLLSFIIKLGLSPFNSWLIGVYNGLTLRSLFFFSTIIKTAVYCAFVNLILTLLLNKEITLILWTVSILSIVIGSVGALYSWRLNNFIGFSGLLSLGTVTILLCEPLTILDEIAIFVYLFVYNVSLIYLMLVYKNRDTGFLFLFNQQNIANIPASIKMGHVANLFSLMNLPPFAGFYAKLLICYILYVKGSFISLVIVLLSGIFAACFYIKLYLVYFLKTPFRIPIIEYSRFDYFVTFCFLLFQKAFSVCVILSIIYIF